MNTDLTWLRKSILRSMGIVPLMTAMALSPGCNGNDKDTEDTDTDTDTDTDPEVTCHPYDPIEVTGIVRRYSVSYNGQSGTETQTHSGIDILSDGSTAYRIDTEMSAGTEGWNGMMYENCDVGEPGLYMLEWTINTKVSISGLPMDMAVTGILSNPRRILPGPSQIGSAGSWSYNYSLSIQSDFPAEIPTSGTYTEMGFASVTVPAGTFDTYCVSNSFTQDRSALEMAGMGGVLNGVSEYCFAENIGLIREETMDQDTGEIVMTKELTSYTLP